jgi:hypothetical protein
MIACISPADANLQETVNTLKYASKARNIKVSAWLSPFAVVAVVVLTSLHVWCFAEHSRDE